MERDLSASIVVRNKNNVWIPDHMATVCAGCQKHFSLYRRKHHCRLCGNIFCYSCTSKSIAIPPFIFDRPKAGDYWNLSHYINSLKGPEEKVCSQCFELISSRIKVRDKILSLVNDPPPLDRVKQLPESDEEAKYYYFDYLRNIQYYLPNHQYNEIDTKLLQANACYLSCHSKYLVHYVKSVYSKKQPDNCGIADSIIGLLSADKIKTCQELYCTRTCQSVLSCDDCINILHSCISFLPDTLIEYFFSIIMKTPEQVIICHLSFFVTLIRKNSNNLLLQKLIYVLLSQSPKLIYRTYWFLNNEKEKTNMLEFANINRFIELFSNELVSKMHQEYLFYRELINHLDDPKRYLIDHFDIYKPITLPYDPDIKIVGVDLEGIMVKDSYTKPVFIPFITNYGKIRLLFKKESVMNDVTVLNLMTLSDIVIGETLQTKFNIVIYPIIPLTAQSGMIEIIDNAETIYSINHNRKTVLQHIIERNENKVISEVLDNYMLSLVSYTLHSYFLGLGDRHTQNLMITDSGCIFHIDFGFILGTDAYPLTGSDIKLNTDMLDVIGGSDSARYRRYLELSSQGVIVLRKYFNMFFILLCHGTKFSEKHIEKFILNRFQPRQTDDFLVNELIEIIRQSNNAYSEVIRDFLHLHKQEKTVQTGISKLLNSAYSIVKNLTSSYHST